MRKTDIFEEFKVAQLEYNAAYIALERAARDYQEALKDLAEARDKRGDAFRHSSRIWQDYFRIYDESWPKILEREVFCHEIDENVRNLQDYLERNENRQDETYIAKMDELSEYEATSKKKWEEVEHLKNDLDQVRKAAQFIVKLEDYDEFIGIYEDYRLAHQTLKEQKAKFDKTHSFISKLYLEVRQRATKLVEETVSL